MQVAVGRSGSAVLERGDRDEPDSTDLPALLAEPRRCLARSSDLDAANFDLDAFRIPWEANQIIATGTNLKDVTQDSPLQIMDQQQHDSDSRIFGDSLLVQNGKDFFASIEVLG